MKTTPIKRRILNVLAQYKDRPYLTIPEITQLAYGVAYIRDTKKGLEKLVTRNMHSARSLAEENNMFLLPVKDRDEETGEIKKSTLGWKIAGKEDAEYISRFLDDKDKRVNAYYRSYNGAIKQLESRNLIDTSKYQLKLMS